MTSHKQFMERCFQLAEKGRGLTGSNPLVGALLVYDGKIISEGFHKEFGGPHAEVNCLEHIDDDRILSNSTLYVSLEPCSHYGKTKPCSEYLFDKKIRKVVIGSLDFNSIVRGNGLKYLKENGVEVVSLNLEEKQKQINISFFIDKAKSEPYLIGKMAVSNDNIYSSEIQKKITNQEIDSLSHKLRSQVDAILVGKNTWIEDSPVLDVRNYYSTKIPDILILTNDEQIVTNNMNQNRIIHSIAATDPTDLKTKIYNLGYKKVLVEGGGEVFRYFMENGIFHEFTILKNRILNLQTGLKIPEIDYSLYELNCEKEYMNHLISEFKIKNINY